MSVTIFLEKHQTQYKIPNPNFNPLEPADDIYNPRDELVDIYPTLNMSNSNAAIFLGELGEFNDSWAGIISRDSDGSYDSILKRLKKFKAVNPKHFYYCSQLEKIIRHAIALNDNVVWC